MHKPTKVNRVVATYEFYIQNPGGNVVKSYRTYKTISGAFNAVVRLRKHLFFNRMLITNVEDKTTIAFNYDPVKDFWSKDE